MLTLLEELLSPHLRPLTCTAAVCYPDSAWASPLLASAFSALDMHSSCLFIHLLQSHEKQEWLLQSLVSQLEAEAFALSFWARAFYPQKVSEPCQYHSDFLFWPPVLFGVNCSC